MTIEISNTTYEILKELSEKIDYPIADIISDLVIDEATNYFADDIRRVEALSEWREEGDY